MILGGVELGVENGDIREIGVVVRVMERVSKDEGVRNVKGCVMSLKVEVGG